MAVIRHTQYRERVDTVRVPHVEQLVLHATILTLAVLVVWLSVVG